MSRLTRRRTKLWPPLLMALAFVPFLLAPIASAEDASNVRPAVEGWYWDRPRFQSNPPEGTPQQVGDALLTAGDPFAQTSQQAFAGDHLWVGWDPADTEDRREMIAGINFDLSEAGVPSEATITKFTLVVLEHPTERGTANAPEARGTFGGATDPKRTRLVACAFPDFIAGSHGAALVEAPKVKCGDAKVGPSSIATSSYYAAATPEASVFAWTFDLTEVMNDTYQKVASGEAFLSVALTPDEEFPSSEPWTTAFHGGFYSEGTVGEDPTPKPGVLASVSWSATEIIDDPFGGFTDEEFTDDSFDTGSELTDEPVAEEPAAPTALGDRPVAGVFGKSVPFWSGLGIAWLAAVFGAGILGLAGWLLTGTDAGGEGRPPGAVSALIDRG